MSKSSFKLSICIATLNRAEYLEKTLAVLLDTRLCDVVEIVVVDGASTDNTSEVVRGLMGVHSNLRYYRESTNSGVDGDFHKAVGYANGQYCWLLADDDLVSPQAIETVLAKILEEPSLLIVNASVHSADMGRTLYPNCAGISEDRTFAPEQWDEFCEKLCGYMSFIGCVVIRRDLWLSRDAESYFGSLFVHCGIVFQKPLPGNVCFVSAPLISIRFGNAQWTPRAFEIWMFMWPSLVWSFEEVSHRAKTKIVAREPWRNIRRVLLYRATGGYDIETYKRSCFTSMSVIQRAKLYCAAILPQRLLNTLLAVYIALFQRSAISGLYQLAESDYATAITRRCLRRLDEKT